MDEAQFEDRSKKHQERAQKYLEIQASVQTTFHHVSETYDKAHQAIVTSGTPVAGQDGNVDEEWSGFGGNAPRRSSSEVSDGGAASIGAALRASVTAARSRRDRQEEMDLRSRIMDVAEERMEANQDWLLERQGEAAEVMEELITATAILEFVSKRNQATNQYVTSVGEKMNRARNLAQKVIEGPPFERIYLGKPGVVASIKSIHADQVSLRIQWDDPDDGESEIFRYRVQRRGRGSWSEEANRFSDEPEVTLEKLKPRTEYEFTITARNPIGWGEESKEFKTQTIP